MTAKRKTIEVSKLKGWANWQLSRKNSDFVHSQDNPEWINGFRDGIATMLEMILHETGNYHGFNYVEWWNEGGYEKWNEDGQPSDNTPYLGNQHRKVYY